MKTHPYISAHRLKYLNPLGEGAFAVGNASQFSAFGPEVTRVAWNKAISDVDLHRVRSLFLRPKPAQVKTVEIPEYVTRLPNLEHIEIPFAFVESLDSEVLPASLRTLQIAYDEQQFGRTDASAARWPNLVLPSLVGLFLSGPHAHLWHHLNIGGNHVPRLEYLNASLGAGHKQAVDAIERFAGLIHVELMAAGNADVFRGIPKDIEYIHLNSTGHKFDASGLQRFESLRSLMLLWMKSPFNIASLEALPELAEIELYGVKKIQNVDSVLSLKRLRRLRLVDCGKPFSKELKAKIAASGLQEVDITFA